MRYKVIVPQDLPETGAAFLRERKYAVAVASGRDAETIIGESRDCDAILARDATYDARVFRACPKLKVVACCGTGINNIDVDAATSMGIQVTNAPLATANAVAEHAIALLLACAKHIPFMDRRVRNGRWDDRGRVKSLEVSGKTLGLVGLGHVGRMTAKKAQDGLEMNVVAFDRFLGPDDFLRDVERADSLEEVAERADFLSLHAPATAETNGCVNKSLLTRMRDAAWLVNCARAELVNEGDLYTALTEGWIAGAAVDVLQNEPPRRDDPLLQLDNLIISPHAASLTDEALDMMGLHAAQGIDEVLRGKTPTWPVNTL